MRELAKKSTEIGHWLLNCVVLRYKWNKLYCMEYLEKDLKFITKLLLVFVIMSKHGWAVCIVFKQ